MTFSIKVPEKESHSIHKNQMTFSIKVPEKESHSIPTKK